MSITLYQFPISHYCEKVRWALDYKGLEWRAENLLPGLHVRQTRKMARRSAVPVLRDGQDCIQGSAAIISWLDERYPERPLTPVDPDLSRQALEWEDRLDRGVGVHVRLFAYHTLLDHPQLVKPMFLAGGRWWWRPFLHLSYGKLSAVMRKLMNINEETAKASQALIEQELSALAEIYRQRDFLVGDDFSRADLAAAALLAPLFMPQQYGVPWPDPLPDPLASWTQEHGHQLDWGRKLYQTYR